MSTSGSDNQTPSPSSRGSFVEKLLHDDDLEPYVRRKNSASESKRRMEGLNEEEQTVVRTSINSRERKRMHDLNDAMDDLRSCLPKIYTDGPGARRLSKINTLMLAGNRIRQLIQLNEKLVAENAQLRSSLSCSPQSQSFKEDVPPSDLPAISAPPSTPRITTPLSTQTDQTNVPTPEVKAETLSNPTQISSHFFPQSTPTIRVPHFPFIPFLPLIPTHLCRKMLGQPCACSLCSTPTFHQGN